MADCMDKVLDGVARRDRHRLVVVPRHPLRRAVGKQRHLVVVVMFPAPRYTGYSTSARIL